MARKFQTLRLPLPAHSSSNPRKGGPVGDFIEYLIAIFAVFLFSYIVTWFAMDGGENF